MQIPWKGWDKQPGPPAVPSREVTPQPIGLGLFTHSSIHWRGLTSALCQGRLVRGGGGVVAAAGQDQQEACEVKAELRVE